MIGILDHRGCREPLASGQWIDAFRHHRFEAAIFDCDGTLVDSAEAHFHAFQQAVAAQGEKMDPGWYRDRTGLDPAVGKARKGSAMKKLIVAPYGTLVLLAGLAWMGTGWYESPRRAPIGRSGGASGSFSPSFRTWRTRAGPRSC